MSNVTGITGKLCNKCPKQQVEQNCSSSDSFNAISGFTSNSRAPGGPVTFWCPMWGQTLLKLQTVKTAKCVILPKMCQNCQKMCKAQKVQKSPKTALSGLANKVPERSVSECFVSARVSIQAQAGPGALSSLPQPSPADSSQVRAQEPCPAAQRFRESA